MPSFFSISVHGAGHIARSQPCEDSSCSLTKGTCTVFAVADGHGDPNCVRSARGSELACAILAKHAERFVNFLHSHGIDLTDPRQADQYCRKFCMSLVKLWLKETAEDQKMQPLTEQERASCEPGWLQIYDSGDTAHIYGTTLIGGILTEDFLLLLHQGDGRCITVDTSGKLSQPVPWDDRCVDVFTTSMCEPDASESFRYKVFSPGEYPIACILATDGLEDAFSGNMDLTYNRVRRYLCDAAALPEHDIEGYLSSVLPVLSAEGYSKDDISIAGFVDWERIAGLLETLEHDRKASAALIRLRSELIPVQHRLDAIRGGYKMGILKRRCEKAEPGSPERAAAEKALQEYCLEGDRLEAEEQQLLARIDALENNRALPDKPAEEPAEPQQEPAEAEPKPEPQTAEDHADTCSPSCTTEAAPYTEQTAEVQAAEKADAADGDESCPQDADAQEPQEPLDAPAQ